jgi:hypothetical protein
VGTTTQKKDSLNDHTISENRAKERLNEAHRTYVCSFENNLLAESTTGKGQRELDRYVREMKQAQKSRTTNLNTGLLIFARLPTQPQEVIRPERVSIAIASINEAARCVTMEGDQMTPETAGHHSTARRSREASCALSGSGD